MRIGNYNPKGTGQDNSMFFECGDLTVYFSYRTPVAFRMAGCLLVVSENVWGATTGKHLNWIDGKDVKNRVDRGEFKKALESFDMSFCYRLPESQVAKIAASEGGESDKNDKK